MARRGSRRPPSAPAARPAKRPRVGGAVAAVMDAIEGARLPEACRKMLLSVIPHSLSVPSDLRDQCQEWAVATVAAALDELHAAMRQAVEVEETDIADIASSKDRLVQGAKLADEQLAAATATTDANTTSLSEAKDAVAGAEVVVPEAQDAQRCAEELVRAAEAAKEKVDFLLQEHFAPLREEGEPGEDQPHLDAITPLAKSLGMDDSLVEAIPGACSKPSSQRGNFDSMVVAEMDRILGVHAQELGAKLDAAAAAHTERTASSEAAAQSALAAKEAWQLAESQHHGALEHQRKMAEHAQEAQFAVAEFEPRYKQATAVRDQKLAELEDFARVVLGSFQALRHEVAKKPEVIAFDEVAADAAAQEGGA